MKATLLILSLLAWLGETKLLKNQYHEGIPQETSDSFIEGEVGRRVSPVVIILGDHHITGEMPPMPVGRKTDKEDEVLRKWKAEVFMDDSEFNHRPWKNEAKCPGIHGSVNEVHYKFVDLVCRKCHSFSFDVDYIRECRKNCFYNSNFWMCARDTLPDRNIETPTYRQLRNYISILHFQYGNGSLEGKQVKDQRKIYNPYRKDLKCGILSDSPFIGLVTPCDEFSDNPCCSPENKCGITKEHCNCKGCIDYRDPEEKATWRSDGRCGGLNRNVFAHAAECRPHGERPCCSNKGFCGKTAQHCKCKGCIDFRKPWRRDELCGAGNRLGPVYIKRGYIPDCNPNSKKPYCYKGICQETLPTTELVCDLDCHNGGICLFDDSAEMYCLCTNGWLGDLCGKPICVHGCFNGGECTNSNICTCKKPWFGPSCLEKAVCYPETCFNGGECRISNNGIDCHCRIGFLGHFCEKPDCTNCYNGGRCTNVGICTCKDGFFGKDCSGECEPHNAKHWSHCKNSGGRCTTRCKLSEVKTSDECRGPQFPRCVCCKKKTALECGLPSSPSWTNCKKRGGRCTTKCKLTEVKISDACRGTSIPQCVCCRKKRNGNIGRQGVHLSDDISGEGRQGMWLIDYFESYNRDHDYLQKCNGDPSFKSLQKKVDQICLDCYMEFGNIYILDNCRRNCYVGNNVHLSNSGFSLCLKVLNKWHQANAYYTWIRLIQG